MQLARRGHGCGLSPSGPYPRHLPGHSRAYRRTVPRLRKALRGGGSCTFACSGSLLGVLEVPASADAQGTLGSESPCPAALCAQNSGPRLHNNACGLGAGRVEASGAGTLSLGPHQAHDLLLCRPDSPSPGRPINSPAASRIGGFRQNFPACFSS